MRSLDKIIKLFDFDRDTVISKLQGKVDNVDRVMYTSTPTAQDIEAISKAISYSPETVLRFYLTKTNELVLLVAHRENMVMGGKFTPLIKGKKPNPRTIFALNNKTKVKKLPKI